MTRLARLARQSADRAKQRSVRAKTFSPTDRG